MPSATSNPRRKSVFREVGLVDDDREKFAPVPMRVPILSTPSLPSRGSRKPAVSPNVARLPSSPTDYWPSPSPLEDVREEDLGDDEDSDCEIDGKGGLTEKRQPSVKKREAVFVPEGGGGRGGLVQAKADVDAVAAAAAAAGGVTKLYRLCVLALLVFLVIPVTNRLPLFDSKVAGPMYGVSAGLIPSRGTLEKRADSPTDVCTRWSHATAIVNGTLYIYGGRATTDADQSSNTWNNDFLTMDLTESWQISSPSFTGLPQPSGPPSVSLAYLWNSRTSLFLYGGEFQDGNSGNTPDYPTAFSLWEYDIPSSSWSQHKDPKTSAGTNAEASNEAVQRAAEGAGANVASLGRGFYFGGHLDTWTTEDWSSSIARIYLKSMVEYTFPGSSNNGVDSLGDDKSAGSDGVWRNITEGGLQETSGFPERADGILVYVPGFGDEGILLGLAGGTNSTFTQMNIIDIYDIATSTWFKQPTSGTSPKIRVNPCAVVAAAADGSSYNMYMFGGQDLGDDQTQYDDMWILTIPSFTWIKVDQGSQSVPPARAGHTCNIWDGQMIVVGGYVGDQLSCDSPGVYVFNTSSLTWGTQFTALSGSSAQDASGAGVFAEGSNPFSQQLAQRGANSSSGLEGSYGYTVPEDVISAVGGDTVGGATVTAPVQTVTAGPMATGKPITYTVTNGDGSTTTTTSVVGAGSNSGSSGGTNVGAIVGGVLAGVFFVIAAYLAFCAWVYRRQLLLYKNHVAMAQAHAADPARAQEKTGFVMPPGAVVGGSLATSSEGGGHPGSGIRNNSYAAGSSGGPTSGSGSNAEYAAAAGGGSAAAGRRSGSVSSTDDLLAGSEPSFWGTRGVLLNPRRSLRVINRD
ncbi:kelch repeat protein [Diplodia corticola]|uniref:Kelch repeat protein n=1 Tax=Diplodia corticola TaxID=236234 RepID=A0A1J9R9W8_9PEZI|nr:kelch repeat protein [Diplodia corticola]OJD36978.1 kelch repeat protein [Diplodia corticola]